MPGVGFKRQAKYLHGVLGGQSFCNKYVRAGTFTYNDSEVTCPFCLERMAEFFYLRAVGARRLKVDAVIEEVLA